MSNQTPQALIGSEEQTCPMEWNKRWTVEQLAAIAQDLHRSFSELCTPLDREAMRATKEQRDELHYLHSNIDFHYRQTKLWTRDEIEDPRFTSKEAEKAIAYVHNWFRYGRQQYAPKDYYPKRHTVYVI